MNGTTEIHMPRPSWPAETVEQFNKRGLLFKLPSRAVDSRLQRLSDHLRGFTFGAATVLALVAAYVFASGAPT